MSKRLIGMHIKCSCGLELDLGGSTFHPKFPARTVRGGIPRGKSCLSCIAPTENPKICLICVDKSHWRSKGRGLAVTFDWEIETEDFFIPGWDLR